jgi:Fe-S-cluster containining protein
MTLTLLLQRYELLVANADQAFQKMTTEFSECIKCKPHCSDCCHAVFGLFLIEAVYLKRHFDKLGRKARRAAILRGKKADNDLKRLEKRLQAQDVNPRTTNYPLERERIRCPLLGDYEECVLYPHRPITCRVYGIPTSIQGKAHVCGKAGFKKGEFYPAFNLDNVQRKLYQLSQELLVGNEEKASILISVSKAIETPLEDIMHGSFEQPDIAD